MAGILCRGTHTQEPAMTSLLPLLCSTLLAPVSKIDSLFEPVAPVPPIAPPARSAGQTRAVVLLHGFIFHFHEASVSKAAYREWQRPGSVLVKTLEKDAD